VPIEGRGYLLGGGAVVFDLAKAQAEPLPTETGHALGFRDMVWEDEG
jgi:hypothetical protein